MNMKNAMNAKLSEIYEKIWKANTKKGVLDNPPVYGLGYNAGITDALKAFEPMFNIPPKAENIVAIIEKLKEVHASIKSLRKDL